MNGRGRSKNEIIEFIDNNPYTDVEAFNQGWVDGITNSSGIVNKINQEYGNIAITNFTDSLNRIKIVKKRGNIAVIPIIGMIVDGKGRKRDSPVPFPILGERSSGDLTIVETIRQIRKKKKKYKGAILYVDSPGGSAASSEAMLSELGQLAKEIPLITFFDGVAASGGYYVGMNSHKIIAQPLTITGSIGVLNVKISTDGVYELRKIKRVSVSRGKNIDITGTYGEWSEDQQKIMQDNILQTYKIFLDHVSRNRELPVEEVEKIAGGRVWLGKQAKELNLIDEIGSIEKAIEEVSRRANIKQPYLELLPVKQKFSVPSPSDHTSFIPQLLNELDRISGKNLLISNLIINIK